MIPAELQTGAFAFAISYVAVLLIMGMVLSIRVIIIRRAERIGLGSGENKLLARRIRAHGNFSEYAPLLMVALLGLALVNAPASLVHIVGVTGITGRIIHAIGLEKSPGTSFGRVGGMILTFTALLNGVVGLLILAWR